MSRRLSLKVSGRFARKLERAARIAGRSKAEVVGTVVAPALDDAEADFMFKAEALAAWETYQLTGASVGARALERQFGAAAARARARTRPRKNDESLARPRIPLPPLDTDDRRCPRDPSTRYWLGSKSPRAR